MDLIVANNKVRVAFCKDILLASLINLEEQTYLNLIMNLITEESLKLIYIPNKENNGASAYIGYRQMYLLKAGWTIYIDYLYTQPEYRRLGYATRLMNFAAQEALESGIQTIRLDLESHPMASKQMYVNHGFELASNHFIKQTCTLI